EGHGEGSGDRPAGGRDRPPMKGKLTLVPSSPRLAPRSGSGAAAIDPVCGMTVDPATAAGSHVHGGLTYWFCSTGCLERFRADPERYLASGPDARAHAPATASAEGASGYTCPMDPEVRQAGPGACPKCGMALEPVTV